MPHDSDQTELYTRMNRRRYLLGGSVALLGGLAGCGGDGGDGTPTPTPSPTPMDGTTTEPTPTTTEGPQLVDQTFRNFMQQNSETAQYNAFNPSNQAAPVMDVIFDPLAGFNQITRQLDPLVAEDWSLDGTSASLTLNDGYTWHNGNPVTATDIKTQLEIGQFTNNPLWEYIGSISVESETELAFDLSTEVNDQVFIPLLLTTRVQAPDSVFGDRLTAVQEASDDNRDQVLNDELLNFSWQEPVGTGPFQFDQATSQAVRLTRFPDHPMADMINFPRYNVRSVTQPEKSQMAISGQLSGGSTANAVVKNKGELPDSYEFVAYTGFNGDGHFFQFDDPLTGSRGFRQAYAYIIDQVVMNETIRPPGTKTLTWRPHTLQTGLMENQKSEWLSGVMDGFDAYQTDLGKAAQALRDDGFTKSGGQWQLPGGEPAELEILIVQGNVSLSGQANFVKQQMDAFGIPTTVRATDFGTYFNAYAGGDFQVTIWIWGGGQPSPYFHFQNEFVGISGPIGYPDTVEVPMPVGDLEGSMQTVNPSEKVAELGRTTDPDASQTLVQELAWIFNQSLPLLQGVDAIWPSLINRNGWQYPETDAEAMGVPSAPDWLPKVGELQASS